ncbi:MAG: glycosyltransferase [Ginsengibacter sp.]
MKHDSKTLLILSPGFPKNEADTTCLPSQQIFVRSLNKCYPALSVIILSFQYPFSNTTYQWYGNKVVPFDGLEKGRIARLLYWRQVWRTMNRLKKENNIIGLLSFWCGECAFMARYFGRSNKLKNLTWIMGQDAKKGNKYIALIQPKPGELMAMSDFLSDEFYKNYGIRPSHVIPNGVAPALFAIKNIVRDITILGVGSLIPLKQYDIFIKVVKEVNKQIPGINSILCGKGALQMELQDLIAREHLQTNLILTGEMPHQETLELMQRAKIFLHPSCYEGFSTACLEALYAGCHVISFIRPMRQDIDHWHVVQNTGEMIAKTVELLLNRKTNYVRVMPYIMDESANTVMRLFGYSVAASS